MPLLAWEKRKLARRTGNSALAADAVQSATCAYLALITLAGLALNAIFHVPWFDPIAALAAIPILLYEANQARRGQTCACC
jgi:divalent metal cation (Fe/Co/Zn/Cd) transporter